MNSVVANRRGPWGPIATVVLGLAIFVVFYLLQLWALTSLQPDLLAPVLESVQPRLDGMVLSIAILLGAAVCSVLVFVAVWARRGPTLREYLRLFPLPKRILLFWLGALVVLMLGWDIFTWAIGREFIPAFMREAYENAGARPLLLVAVAVGAPFFEEVFFRGFLFEGLSRSRIGAWGAIVATAVVWALVHLQYDPYEMFSVFVLGLIFGYARVRTGSLVTPMAMHALANTIAFIEVALTAG